MANVPNPDQLALEGACVEQVFDILRDNNLKPFDYINNYGQGIQPAIIGSVRKGGKVYRLTIGDFFVVISFMQKYGVVHELFVSSRIFKETDTPQPQGVLL